MAKRLGVFCFFDKDEIIQRCDEYLLEELKKNVEQLIVVINGNINKNSLDVIHRLADKIYVRSNKGYDGGAYSDVFLKASCIL